MEQIDTVVKAMKAGGLGVHRQEGLSLQSLEELLKLSLAVDQADRWMRRVIGSRGNAHPERLLGTLTGATGP